MLDEKLSEKAERLGKVLREELEKLPKDKVTTVRGRGLMYALVIHDSEYYSLVYLVLAKLIRMLDSIERVCHTYVGTSNFLDFTLS